MTEGKVWRLIFSLFLIGVALVFLARAWVLLVPFGLGFLAAYMIHPYVNGLVAFGLRRDRVVLLLYVLVFVSVAAMALFVLPHFMDELQSALREIPRYATGLDDLLGKLSLETNKALQIVMGENFKGVLIPFNTKAYLEGAALYSSSNLTMVVHFGLWLFIVPFVAYFALTEGSRWVDQLFDWTPSRYVENLLGFIAEVNATLGGYVRGQLLDGACVGGLVTIGLWFVGFDSPVLLGVLAGMLNVVPLFGPLIAGGVALLLAYFNGMAFAGLFGIFCVFLLVRLCDDFFIMPFVLGQNVKLHPIVIIFAILTGSEVGGVLGLLVAVPLAAVLKIFFGILFRTRQERILLENYNVAS